MTEQVQQIILNKILENSSIFINKIEINLIDLTDSGVASAINFSSAITLNSIFTDNEFNSPDLNSIYEKLSIEIINRSNNKNQSEQFLFNSDFLKSKLISANKEFHNKKINAEKVKMEIIALKQEFMFYIIMQISQNLKDVENKKQFLFYNTLTNLYIYPLINSNDKKDELLQKIKNELIIDKTFLEVKDKFTDLIDESIADILDNCSQDQLFISTCKSYKTKKIEVVNVETKNKNCYVASLVYEDIDHPNVEFLRNFRDNTLLNNFIGKLFIKIYYLTAPDLIIILKPYKKIQKLIRLFIDKIILILKNEK